MRRVRVRSFWIVSMSAAIGFGAMSFIAYHLPVLLHVDVDGSSHESLAARLAAKGYAVDRCAWGDFWTGTMVAPLDARVRALRLRCHVRAGSDRVEEVRAEVCVGDAMPARDGIAPLHRVPPRYPLHQDGPIVGRVLIEFGVDRDGFVVAPDVLAHEGEVFIAPALEAVARWVYCTGPGYDPARSGRQKIAFVFEPERG